MQVSSTMRRDVISAYGANVARILSWIVVSAAVYRINGPPAFAFLSLVRGTIGILNYASIGLAPAMIRLLAEARAPRAVIPVEQHTDTLSYYADQRPTTDPVHAVYVNGIIWGIIACAIGAIILKGYLWWVETSPSLSGLTRSGEDFVVLFGAGILIRLFSDPSSAALQTSGKIVLDNVLVIIAELTWAALSLISLRHHITAEWGVDVGRSFLLASLFLLVARLLGASENIPNLNIGRLIDRAILARLLGFGSLVTLAQLADYLYAPTDFLLITYLLHPIDAGIYSPAVQIDAGLLMLVSALAAVILPKTALAHVNENRALIRRYYVVGTAASAGVLLIATALVWIGSSLLFRLWFGDSMPATRAILPLVLLNTIIGGSAIVGRSILLGMGKVKPFTIAVLIAGVSNVLLSWLFVAKFHLGLPGIILGTIAAVIGRCLFWMPWYVLRTLKREA